jgi:hypothetical protein
MGERTNRQRAASAAVAVKAYARETHTWDDEDVATHISDLICDLSHLANQHGLDPTDLIERGLDHHAAEAQEEYFGAPDHTDIER